MEQLMTQGLCLFFLSLLLHGIAAGQAAAPTAAKISQTLYFPDAANELADRQALHAQVGPTEKDLSACPENELSAQLDRAWKVVAVLERHAAYWKVKTLEDREDKEAKNVAAEVEADQTAVRAAIEARLGSIQPDQIPALGKYAYLVRTVQADESHALEPNAQRYREAVTVRVLGDTADSYDALAGRLEKSVEPAGSDLAARRSRAAAEDSAYGGAAPVAAALLNTLVDMENREAVAEGYANAAERKYASLRLTDTMVNAMLASVEAQAGAYQHYEEVLAKHAQERLGVPAVSSSDVALAATAPSHLSWSDGQALILGALRPLGEDYTRRFANLLDPANGRLDLSGGAHRSPRGTSIAVFDGPVALYVGNYDGSLAKLSTVAHEGGHAIHRELMNDSGIPIYERTGPHFLNEGYAILNELLLLDYAAKTAQTRQAREAALERLLAKISLELYVSAEETRFERDLYVANSKGQPLDRVAVDEIYRRSVRPLEYWPVSDIGTSRAWMRKSLIYEDPLYLVNYLYAAVIAVALYEKAQSNPGFAADYDALLRRGFDADPLELLSSIGVDLNKADLVTSAAHLLRAKSDELEELYRQDDHKLTVK
jgi:oligoendopeptidase F